MRTRIVVAWRNQAETPSAPPPADARVRLAAELDEIAQILAEAKPEPALRKLDRNDEDFARDPPYPIRDNSLTPRRRLERDHGNL